MIIDIIMAFIVAILLEKFSVVGLKRITTFVFCFTIIFIYIFTGWQINFIGKMDFGAWIMFTIIFDEILMFVINKLKK